MCYIVIFFNQGYIQLFVGNVSPEYTSCMKLFAERQGSSRWEFHCFTWNHAKKEQHVFKESIKYTVVKYTMKGFVISQKLLVVHYPAVIINPG